MKSNAKLIVYGSLRKLVPGHHDLPIDVDINLPSTLPDILERFKIPLTLVKLIMLNHRAVPLDTTIMPGDRLSLFPREYPIFVDWHDMTQK